MDLGPKGKETLESFSIDFDDLRKLGRSWGWTVDPDTGQMEFFELPLDGKPGKLKLTFTNPVYSVEGPWVFTFPVD